MHSSSRNGARVRLLTVHTTEGITRVRDLRDWKSWAGSSHAACDDTGALWGPDESFVPYDRAAWTLRSGNTISDNLEQCCRAVMDGWTRADWLARPKLLDATARWLAERSVARGIPLVKLTPAEVRAGKAGVIGHVDWTVGMDDGTHSDPGKHYPWDVVLAKANAYRNGTPLEDDVLSPEQDQMLRALHNRIMGRDVQRWMKQEPNGDPIITGPEDRDGWPARSVDIADLLQLRKELLAGDQQTRSVIDAAGRATVDIAALKAALLPDLEAAVAKAGPGATVDQLADELAARLAS